MVFLKGNHEDMLLGYLGFAGRYGEMFLANGGQATLASYGMAPVAMSQVAPWRAFPPIIWNFFSD